MEYNMSKPWVVNSSGKHPGVGLHAIKLRSGDAVDNIEYNGEHYYWDLRGNISDIEYWKPDDSWIVNSGSIPAITGSLVSIIKRRGTTHNKPLLTEKLDWELLDDPDDILYWKYCNEQKSTNFHGEFSAMSKETQDDIINPKHYKILPSEVLEKFLYKGMEYMDIMRYALSRHTGVVAHVLGQVFKYSFRLGGKDDTLQDAKKIAWYANRLVEEIEFERGVSDKKPRGEYGEND